MTMLHIMPKAAAFAAEGACAKSDDPFFPPNITTDRHDSMSIMRKRVFDRLLSMQTLTTNADVRDRTNASHYGLAAGLSSHEERRNAYTIKFGTVQLNCGNETEMASPFGKVKPSEFGCEMDADAISLHGPTNSVWIG